MTASSLRPYQLHVPAASWSVYYEKGQVVFKSRILHERPRLAALQQEWRAQLVAITQYDWTALGKSGSLISSAADSAITCQSR